MSVSVSALSQQQLSLPSPPHTSQHPTVFAIPRAGRRKHSQSTGTPQSVNYSPPIMITHEPQQAHSEDADKSQQKAIAARSPAVELSDRLETQTRVLDPGLAEYSPTRQLETQPQSLELDVPETTDKQNDQGKHLVNQAKSAQKQMPLMEMSLQEPAHPLVQDKASTVTRMILHLPKVMSRALARGENPQYALIKHTAKSLVVGRIISFVESI